MGNSVELKELDNSQKYPQSKLIKSAQHIKKPTDESNDNELSINYPYPADGVLKDLHKEDFIK